MTIRAILERKGREVVTIQAAACIREAVSLLAARRIGALPVLDDRGIAGIISERDVIHCLDSDGGAALDRTIGEVMTAPPISVTQSEPILSALAQMSRRRIRHLPVVEENQLLGIVSIGDLVQYRIERIEEEARAMRAYIQAG